jgi:hypothetical protein
MNKEILMLAEIDFRWYMYFLILSGLFVGSVIGFTVAAIVEPGEANGIVGLEAAKITLKMENESV